ncbi:MAG: MFS transporter [Deltaproteobacteria bacterium]|nr:MFS transporter [Deltaproteobacteria bacterium]
MDPARLPNHGDMSEQNSPRGALIELVVNVAAPTLVLLFLAGDAYLGPVWSLVVALAFPLGHSLYTMATARRVSPIAVLVFISVLLTGGIGLLELEVQWFAWKEAAFPLAIGVAVVASVKTRWPALPTLLAPLLDQAKVDGLLEERGRAEAHEADLVRATWQVGAVLVLTAVGTYAFARFMVTSATGTEAFNTELGRYTGLALPVLGIPSTVLMVWILRNVLIGVEEHTGVEIQELLK